MTVGTGVGEDADKRISSLANGLLYSIERLRPKKIVFFGSEKSKLTITALKEKYSKKHGEDLPENGFVLINDIDDFSSFYDCVQEKIDEFDDYEIIIDYTSGTKTMTAGIAIASVLNRCDLYVVSGTRESGVVKEGTEVHKEQSLYKVYDKLVLDEIKSFFNKYQYEACIKLLGEVRSLTNSQKEDYKNLILSYKNFDSFNHKDALEIFDNKSFSEILGNKLQIIKNNKTLNIITNKKHKQNKEYILASLLNNALRRSEEGKYDDAIARLYRSLELISQIKLEERGYDSSNFDVLKLKKEISVNDFDHLHLNKPPHKDFIEISLAKGFSILKCLGEGVGAKYKKNKAIKNSLKLRNKSILAHGLEPRSKEEFEELWNLTFEFAKEAFPSIEEFLSESEFPKFKGF